MANQADCAAFTAALRDALSTQAAEGGEVAGDCTAILRALPQVLPSLRPGPPLPVVSLLDGTVGRTSGTKLEPVARAFGAYARGSAWYTPPTYRDAGLDPAFFDNYGVVKFMGPGTDLPGRGVAGGATLQGPNIFYPPHAHPARELYIVLSGTGEWLRGTEGWTKRAPGSFIVHSSMQQHAMRTGGEPILTLWFWLGDLDTPSRITSLT